MKKSYSTSQHDLRIMASMIAMLLLFVLIIFIIPHVNAIEPSESERLDVTKLGAVGDGITDCHDAIQKAIDEASDGRGSNTVYFPAGTYRVGDVIALKSNINVILDDQAVILNGINKSSYASIVFMTGNYKGDASRTEWKGISNVTFSGGTIDMNGTLNEDGTRCENLNLLDPLGSTGAFALGYSKNITIKNVNFLNSYKGHAMQICACDTVVVENCNFLGQAIPSILPESNTNNLETVQIEPGTRKGFPYAMNDNGIASTNITIQNCYFGKSKDCGEPIVAIGTHNQVSSAQKCNDIKIYNNTFENMYYGGLLFCGYEDVVIQGNTFIKEAEGNSTRYRENGCFLINAYCYNNTKETLDLNSDITITENTFTISDPKTRAIRVARDKDSYLGDVRNISITNNRITNTAADSKDIAIQALRISDDLVITGNYMYGGYRGIEVQYSTGAITLDDNHFSGLAYQYVRILACGDNQAINLFTHGPGALRVSTANNKYTFRATPCKNRSFNGYYGENALTTLVTQNKDLTYSIGKTTEVFRHASFS